MTGDSILLCVQCWRLIMFEGHSSI